ncbi:metal-dependent transcriptional regulator [Thermophilibacter sp.]
MSEAIRDTHTLSKAGEDYLEAIYRISLAGGDSVRSVDVAESLGVSKASVNKALSTLKEAGMVEQSRYGRVTLTEEGRTYAAAVWRSHRALRTFLESDLGVEPQTADSEACLMEHVLSEDTMRRLIAYLEEQGLVVPEE